MRVLFDTNIILDVLLNRLPFYPSSAQALDTVLSGQVEGFVAAHAVATLAYLLQRQLGMAQSRAALSTLLAHLKVAAVTDAVVRQALGGDFRDFEDAITYGAAQALGLDLIISRNTKDFLGSGIPAVLPDVFLAGQYDSP
ncbi:MAG: PIN domain-containing protein [Synechococcales cyanobacterium]